MVQIRLKKHFYNDLPKKSSTNWYSSLIHISGGKSHRWIEYLCICPSYIRFMSNASVFKAEETKGMRWGARGSKKKIITESFHDEFICHQIRKLFSIITFNQKSLDSSRNIPKLDFRRCEQIHNTFLLSRSRQETRKVVISHSMPFKGLKCIV